MKTAEAINIDSKLPNVGTTIFTVMSAMAKEAGAVNLSQGFPDFDCDPDLLDRVTHYMKEGYNQYTPMTGYPGLNDAISKKIKRSYGVDVDPVKEITVTAGATQAIFTAITALIGTDDEVIIVEPAYDCYAPAIRLNQGIVRRAHLRYPDYSIDWEEVKRLVSQRTKMIIINTPHNPTGSILSENDMKQLEKIVSGSDIVILSDEVYEHIIFDGEEHQSVLKYPGLSERSMAVFSFGKTFHVTGWKLGYCVGPEALMKEFRKVHQFNVFTCNTPMQMAIADHLGDSSNYEKLSAFYQAKRDVFANSLEGSKFKLLPCKGTYFQLVDYSAISDKPDTQFAEELTREHGVAAIPVSVFYENKEDNKVVRLCFAKNDGTLKEAGELLCKI